MASLNLHNHANLVGAYIVRAPHCEGLGITVGGSQIAVDDIAGSLYCRRTLSSQYTAGYASTSLTQTLDPTNVWASYDPLTSIPAWLTSDGIPTAGGIVLDNDASVTRSNQTLSNVMFGIKFTFADEQSLLKVHIGEWSMTLRPYADVVFDDGLVTKLQMMLETDHEYGLVIEQKQDVLPQSTTLIIRIDGVAFTDCAPRVFSATGALSLVGNRVTVSGWRQGVGALIAPTLSLVQKRADGLIYDVDSSGNLYQAAVRNNYWIGGMWSYEDGGTEYQFASFVGVNYAAQGVLQRRTLPGGSWSDVLTFPQSYSGGTPYGVWFAMQQWNFARDNRGWIYVQAYGLGTWKYTEPQPDPLPMIYRSKDNGTTWEQLPLAHGMFSFEQLRHGHALWYHPDKDVLYASFGEYGTYNVFKFSNLSAANVADVTVAPIPWISRKGPLSTRYNGTSTLFVPPDEYPITFLRLDTNTDTWHAGPLHYGLFGGIKFALAPVPTEFGTLMLSDSTNFPEMPPLLLAYSAQYGTLEDVTETRMHSRSRTAIKAVGDAVYFAWQNPPIAHNLGTANLVKNDASGLAVHEYWNGSSWIEMSVTPTADGYSLPTDITDWHRASAAELGCKAWTQNKMFWTRMRCTDDFATGKTASLADDYNAHPALLAIYSAYGDSCDTEVEWLIKDELNDNGRDICFYEPGKTLVAWTTMPFTLAVSGTLDSTSLDPESIRAESDGAHVDISYVGTPPFRIERRVL